MTENQIDAPRLRALRESHGLTLREVENRTGINYSYLSRLERGLVARTPRYPVIAKLSDLYGVYSEELMREGTNDARA